MIIDLILDRQDGIPYDPKKFYEGVMGYWHTLGTGQGIADAMDGGEEEDVKKEIREYLVENGYVVPGNENKYADELITWINSVNWITA